MGLRATLSAWGVPEERVTELTWGERRDVLVARTGARATVVCVPAQHWSQRGAFDRCKVGAVAAECFNIFNGNGFTML